MTMMMTMHVIPRVMLVMMVDAVVTYGDYGYGTAGYDDDADVGGDCDDMAAVAADDDGDCADYAGDYVAAGDDNYGGYGDTDDCTAAAD